MDNPEPNKQKRETTIEESFRASLLKEVERKFYEQKKFFQQKV